MGPPSFSFRSFTDKSTYIILSPLLKYPVFSVRTFYFILNKVAPIRLVEKFYIFRPALQNDWMIRTDDDWFCFFFTRRGALPLFRVPPHCSLNVFVRMALPTINTPPSPIILKFWNTQYSAKGRQSVFVHRRKKTCGRCPCIFQGGSAHLPVWAQTLLLAQWWPCVNTTLLTALFWYSHIIFYVFFRLCICSRSHEPCFSQ